MKKTRILITGASGFVGGSFCRQFQHRGDLEIRGLGRRPSMLPGYIRADLTKPLDHLPGADPDWIPDVVIHGAARSSPWGSLSGFRRQNVLATRHVLEYCRLRQVPRVIYISSSSVFYQDRDQLNLTEESPLGPAFANHYARTKAEGEALVRQYPGSWAILRPRAVFGPHDTVVFPRIIRAARKGRMARISRPGPPAIGDLIYIDSLCAYLLRAARDPEAQGDFNLTNNQPVILHEFLARLFERLGLPPVRRVVPWRKAMRAAAAAEAVYKVLLPWLEPPITRFGVGVLAFSKTFDVRKSLAAFGPPEVDLEEGFERFVNWQLDEWRREKQRP